MGKSYFGATKKIGAAKGLGDIWRNVLLLAGGTAISQVLALVVTPILTRIYGPEQFGVLAAFVSILSVLTLIASGRYDTAILLPKEDRAAANVLALALIVTLGNTILSLVLVAVLGAHVSPLFGHSDIGNLMWLVPVGVLGTGVYQTLSYWAIRKDEYGRIAKTRLNQAVGRAFTQVVLGMVWGASPLGLVLGDLVGRFAGSTSLARQAYRRDRELLRSVRMSEIAAVAIRYKKFPLVASWAVMLNTLGLQMPTFVLSTLFGSTVVGYFSLGLRLLNVPTTMLGQAVAQVFMQKAAVMAHEDRAGLRRLFTSITKRLLYLAIGPGLVLFFFSPDIFAIVFGDEWRLAGYYTRYLVPVLVGQFVVSPLAQLFNVLEKQDLQLIWDATRLVLVTISLLVGAKVGGPIGAVQWYSATLTLLYVALYVTFRYYLRVVEQRY